MSRQILSTSGYVATAAADQSINLPGPTLAIVNYWSFATLKVHSWNVLIPPSPTGGGKSPAGRGLGDYS
jgi:hypothetical protein